MPSPYRQPNFNLIQDTWILIEDPEEIFSDLSQKSSAEAERVTELFLESSPIQAYP